MNLSSDLVRTRFLSKVPFEQSAAAINGYIALFDNYDGNDVVSSLINQHSEFINRQLVFVTVLKGHIELTVNGEKHILTPATVSYIATHSVIRVLDASEDFYFFLYSVSSELVRDVFNDIGVSFKMPSNYRQFLQRELTTDELKYRMALYSEQKRDLNKTASNYQKHVAQAYTSVLFSNDIDMFEPELPDSEKAISRQHMIFCQFVDMLAEHTQREREVQFYARQLGITPKYLSALCIEYSGKNASAWIDDYVISRIKHLMQEHRYNVKEISQVMNFPTQSFFGRYFKRVTGFSPRQYMVKNQLI